MTPNTPSFDFSAFTLNRVATEEIRRSAELARSAYLGGAVKQLVRRFRSGYRSTTDLLGYAQRMNQAARL